MTNNFNSRSITSLFWSFRQCHTIFISRWNLLSCRGNEEVQTFHFSEYFYDKEVELKPSFLNLDVAAFKNVIKLNAHYCHIDLLLRCVSALSLPLSPHVLDNFCFSVPRPIIHPLSSPSNMFCVTSLDPDTLPSVATLLMDVMFYSGG